jgi:DNA repair photolyase
VTSNQVAAPARPPVQLTSETCTSLLRVNDAPELPFALSINPYRGCEHACVFCPVAPVAAAASGSGPDGADAASATVIYAKSNAAERLRIELRRPGYRARPICLGSAADAYQPVERQQRLTRALIEVLAQARHPFGLTTRSAGVVRDLDLLAPLAEQGLVLVLISLSTLDPWLAARLEPGASLPAQRLAAMRSLARAGVWVGLNLAPLLPGVNDDDGLEALIAAAAQAGARAVRWQGLGIGVGVGAALHILQQGEAHRVDDDAWRSSVAERVRSATLGAGLSSELPQLDTSLFQLPSAPEQPGERGHSQKSLF